MNMCPWRDMTLKPLTSMINQAVCCKDGTYKNKNKLYMNQNSRKVYNLNHQKAAVNKTNSWWFEIKCIVDPSGYCKNRWAVVCEEEECVRYCGNGKYVLCIQCALACEII